MALVVNLWLPMIWGSMGETWCVELSSIFCKNFLLKPSTCFRKDQIGHLYVPTNLPQVQSFESIFVEAYQLFWTFSEPRGHGAVLFASRILLASCHNPTKSWPLLSTMERWMCATVYIEWFWAQGWRKILLSPCRHSTKKFLPTWPFQLVDLNSSPRENRLLKMAWCRPRCAPPCRHCHRCYHRSHPPQPMQRLKWSHPLGWR